MIQRRMLLSPEPASPVKSGEPLKTMASREPPSGLHLGDHVLQEEKRAVVDTRQAGAEAAVVAQRLVLVADEASPAASTPRRRAGWRACSRSARRRGRPSVKLSPKAMFSRFWPLIIRSEPQMA